MERGNAVERRSGRRSGASSLVRRIAHPVAWLALGLVILLAGVRVSQESDESTLAAATAKNNSRLSRRIIADEAGMSNPNRRFVASVAQ